MDAPDTTVLDLGLVLGELNALGSIAGRCTAAQAAHITQIREKNRYQATGLTWQAFCPAHLKISRSEADKIIAAFQQYGSTYFELAQLTRISPKTYSLIVTSIRSGKLHYDGEILDIQPINAAKVAAAIRGLRQDYKNSPNSKQPFDQLGKLSRRCDALIRDFETHLEDRTSPNWHRAANALRLHHVHITRTSMSYGIQLED